jgi:tetratricopeptide (TPR) repeat protein
LGNLGNVLFIQGDLADAEQMYRKSLEIDEKLGRLEGLTNAYLNLGMVLSTQGDLVGAEQMFLKSLDAAERLGSPQPIARVNYLLGTLPKSRPKRSNND